MKKFCLTISFYSLLFCLNAAAQTLPNHQDINSLDYVSKKSYQNFMAESFEIRLFFEFNESSLTEKQKNNLKNLAKKTSETLQQIKEQQLKFNKQIENYEGDDWDIRFGENSLWKNLSFNINSTAVRKAQADFYLALTNPTKQKEQILHNIIDQFETFNKFGPQPIKAKALVSLSQINPAYKPLAMKELDVYKLFSDIRKPVTAAIETIKLTDSADPETFKNLFTTLQQNRSNRYFDLVLQLLLLQRKHDSENFKNSLGIFPETHNLLGKFILQTTQPEKNLNSMDITDAELIAKSLIKTPGPDYQNIFKKFLTHQKFHTPVIIYCSAVNSAESDPDNSAEKLITAALLQKQKESPLLELSYQTIAKQAALLAYNSSLKSPDNCLKTLEIFEQYFSALGPDVDPKIEYLHAVVLKNCEQSERAASLLQKISKNPNHPYNEKAKIDITLYRISQRPPFENSTQALELLTQAEKLPPDIYSHDITLLLSYIAENIDTFTEEDLHLLQKAKALAENFHDSSQDRKSALLLAEISLAPALPKKNMEQIENLLNNVTETQPGQNIDSLRCKARFLTVSKNFESAAKLWAKLANAEKMNTNSPQKRSPSWFRAKYYELYCCRKSGLYTKKNILRTIEIIQNSFTDIPPFWAKKLDILKQ